MSLRRTVRNLSIGLSLILVLLIGLVVYILTLDPNQFRGQITDLAARQGIELQIDGDMAWRLYPNLSLEISQIRVAGTQPQMNYQAGVERIELLLELWPLLRREFRLRGLNVVSADLALTQLEPAPVETPQPDGAATAAEPPAPGALPVLVAERMEFTDTSLRIVDASGVESLAMTDFDLLIQNLNLTGEPVQIQGSAAELRRAGEPALGLLDFALVMNLLPDSVALDVSRLGAELPVAASVVPVNLSGQMVLQLQSKDFSLSNFSVQVADQLQAGLNLNGQLTPLNFAGSLDLPVTNPRELAAALGHELPELGPDSLQRFSLQADLRGGPTSIDLSSLRWQLDQSSFQGSLQYGWGELSSFVLRGQLNQFNLDDYRPAVAETEEPPAAEPAGLLLALPFNRSDIDLEISSLQVAEIPMQRVHLVLTSNTRQMRVQELSAQLFGGSFNANALLYVTGDLPHQFEFQASGIAIDQFLATRMEEVPFAGSVSMQLTGLASGLDVPGLTQSLEADGRLQATGLVFRGQDIEQVMCDISDRLQRRSLQSNYADWGEATNFEDVDASLRVQDGVARLQSLRSGIGNFGVTGQGSFNLELKDYQLNLGLRVDGEQTSIQGCTVHALLRNREIPLECSGNGGEPDSLSCGVPQEFTRSLLTGVVTQQLQNQLLGDDAEEAAEGEQEPTPRNLIEGLLRRSLGQ